MKNGYLIAVVNQSLPSLQSLNASLYMVNAGYQDYFFSLYNQTLIPAQALDIVPSVVDAIITAIRVSLNSLINGSLFANGYIPISQTYLYQIYLIGFRQVLDKGLI